MNATNPDHTLGKGFIWKLSPKRNWILVLEMIRFTLMATLVLWWGYLLWHLAESHQYVLLQDNVTTQDFSPYNRILLSKRMIFGESIAVILLLVLSSCMTLWLYVRDIKRLRSIETFFAAMTHELRTPLASVSLQAQMLNGSLENPEKSRKYTERLLADVARLDSQVEKILETARVIRGSRIRLEHVSVNDTIQKAFQQLPLPAQESVTLTLPTEHHAILGDPYLLQVVFRNLLENAVKHGRRETLNISVTTTHAGNNLVITFQDDGQGTTLNPQTLGQSFVTGHDGKGSGVGLYLVASLVKSMSGTIQFLNANGFAARLTLRKAA